MHFDFDEDERLWEGTRRRRKIIVESDFFFFSFGGGKIDVKVMDNHSCLRTHFMIVNELNQWCKPN